MSEMNQGDEYTEDFSDLDTDDGMISAESYEDTEEPPITTIFGFPKKYVILGGAGAVALLLLLIMIATRKPKEEDIVYPEDMYVSQETYVEDAYVEDVYVEPEEEEIAVGTELNGFVWDGTDWVVPYNPLDDETNKKLRAAGYTGDEIEYAIKNNFDLDALVAASQELYDLEAAEALKRMSDVASDEFKYLLEFSYFGQPGYEFINQNDVPIEEVTMRSYDFTVNADYVKCPTYGNQLMLKCKVANDLYVFYVVTPQRFAALPEKGNIALQVDCMEYGPNTYVTKLTELNSNIATIDSATSDVDLEEFADEEVTEPVEVETADADSTDVE